MGDGGTTWQESAAGAPFVHAAPGCPPNGGCSSGVRYGLDWQAMETGPKRAARRRGGRGKRRSAGPWIVPRARFPALDKRDEVRLDAPAN